jgi:hypothetical protein
VKTSYRPRLELLENRCVPATFTVTKLDDAVGAPGRNLREAIELANNNDNAAVDRIVFKTGLKGTINLDAGLGDIDISESVKILGPGANKITISGQDAIRIFNIDNNDLLTALDVTIGKLTLTRGQAAGSSGGAILNQEKLTVTRCTLIQNAAGSDAGAIQHFSAFDLIVDKCKFLSNRSTFGGAVRASGTLIVRDSLFAHNRSISAGSAIYADTDAVTIENSVISGNTALTGAGALTVLQSALNINRTTISDNVSGWGGGMYLLSLTGDATITNSTISGNLASHPTFGQGGGIFSFSTGLILRNSTLSGNAALGNGGGLYSNGASGSLTILNSTIAHNLTSDGQGGGIFLKDHDAVLQSTIVARNVAFLGGPDLYSNAAGDEFFTGFSLIEDDSDATITPTPLQPNVIGQNPLLGPLQNYGGPTPTHALLAGSPAINAGSNPNNEVFDQRGPKFKRVKGGLADIGAFER